MLGMPDPILPALPPKGGLRLSPTDISQFIRLEQCERYLRLRLHERASGAGFLPDYGVSPQAIPPLLTRSGRTFEERVEAAVTQRYPVLNLAGPAQGIQNRAPDNARVAAEARSLAPGETRVLLQPRLQVDLDGWRFTGDADLLRLERAADGTLDLLITDMKSSTAARVEHRLQVAFYHEMLARLFAEAGMGDVQIRTGILYRGPADSPEEPEPEHAAQAASARDLFGLEDALLELVEEPEAYRDSVRDLVTGPYSRARLVTRLSFAELPFHLSYKCDGCLYNEFCMKQSAETDDLSLIPHLSSAEKGALQRAGVATTRELSLLKELVRAEQGAGSELVPAPGKEALCRKVATAWPVGPRVDELIHRARRYRKWRKDPVEALPYIPSQGYGSLPYSDAKQNPNLIRVYIDTQHDYLEDRIYMLGARVAACAGGVPVRSKNIVHLADGPPDSAERERRLFVRWINDLLRTVVQLAEPDADGQARAPIHLIFFDSSDQRRLLEGLSRHFGSILGAAPALYDFMTQLAAYDSPIATFLDAEIRELKNYPMVCQSLQAVAAFLKFKWDEPEPFTKLFRARMFDVWRKAESDGTEPDWYTGRARFNSQIPLEYAYAAWGELGAPKAGTPDELEAHRRVDRGLLQRFQARRLEALEHIAADFAGNKLTEKRAFHLPELASFSDTARSLAQALEEFVTIERHVELHAWKMVRHAPPERRVLMGETLIARYEEADQAPDVAERNRENERRRLLKEQQRAEYFAGNPDAKKMSLSKDEKAASQWSQGGMRFRLRLETAGLDCSLDEALGLGTWQPGDRFVLNPRWTVDSRLPLEEQAQFLPTPKQMLYGVRADLVVLELERDDAGRAVGGVVEVEMADSFGFQYPGFVFSAIDRPLQPGMAYTLDPCPNSIYGYWSHKVVEGLRAIEDGKGSGRNALYDRIAAPGQARVDWPAAAAEGQRRFLAGLDALHRAGLFHPFEASKREYIGGHGDAPALLVQGPPGTGKSYSTGFALFARMQGAMAAGREFRALVCCKTHAATDVLLENVLAVREKLRELFEAHPELCAEYFDPRLLETPLFRIAPKSEPPEGIQRLVKDADKQKGEPKNADAVQGPRWCVAGAAPGGIYGTIKGKWSGKDDLFGHYFCDCLVLDEASQMNLPEAAMAALPLRPEGQLIVVGDHRQMPPIVQHDWEGEPRRTFREYQAFESLFRTLLLLEPPLIQFAESFRLHADMAEFLRQEIYRKDGIDYHSHRKGVLPDLEHDDAFVAAVLAPEHPIVVVLHEESGSQTRNPYEQGLIAPVLEALADPARYGLDADEGLGVVVPHRAQRAAMQIDLPCLAVRDAATGVLLRSAVDTVERFQGGERTAIVVSATESDREYLLASSKFLLDPRRLTVAASRAKRKLILVASRSVFSLFSPDEEAFVHLQLWKNLLQRTCATLLWEGERDGHRVQVWGNGPAASSGRERPVL